MGDAVAAIESIGRYRVTSTLDQTVISNAVTRNVTVESTGLVDRSARRLHANLTQQSAGQALTIERYLADGWVYEHSDAYRQEYGAAWVKRALTENYSVTWRNNDELGILRAILGNGSVTTTSRDTLDGTAVRVVAIEANATAVERYLLGRNVSRLTFANVTAEVWLDEESGRPLRVVRSMQKYQRAGDRRIRFDLTVRAEFEFGVDERVTLSTAARDARSLSNTTDGG